jgi:cytochrome c oxidase assembly protein subunit 15
MHLTLAQLGLTGLIVALLPLSMVWISSDPNKYRKLAWVSVFLTFDLVMFGAFTRLSDSGLGCPDWPGCYGTANPFLAHDEIRAAEALMPTGPVTLLKAWIEMIHRYVAMAIGVLIIGMMVQAWRVWIKSRQAEFSPWLPTALFLFVCLQGAFGAWTVTLKLQPVIVTTHLLLGMGLLAMLTWLASRQDAAADARDKAAPAPVVLSKAGGKTEAALKGARAEAPVKGSRAEAPGTGTPRPRLARVYPISPPPVMRRLRLLAGFAGLLLVVQIALGGWVSTNYATLACTDFPLCGGKLVPPMDFEHGFTLWRELGKTAAGHYLPFSALTAIHWVHRSFALVVLLGIGYTAWRAWQYPGLRRTARLIALVLVVQVATGIATIFLDFPLVIAVLHNGGAALLVVLLTMLNYRAKFHFEIAQRTAWRGAPARSSAAKHHP